jgi:hypothetical protein
MAGRLNLLMEAATGTAVSDLDLSEDVPPREAPEASAGGFNFGDLSAFDAADLDVDDEGESDNIDDETDDLVDGDELPSES